MLPLFFDLHLFNRLLNNIFRLGVKHKLLTLMSLHILLILDREDEHRLLFRFFLLLDVQGVSIADFAK